MHQLTAEREDDWSAIVDEHPKATAFHRLPWKHAIEESIGYEPQYLIWYRDQAPVAVIPAFETPELIGRSLVAPFCAHGYPLLGDAADPTIILESMAQSKRSLFGVRIIKERQDTGVRGYHSIGYGAVRTAVTFRLQLDIPYESLRDQIFDTSLQKNLQRARDRGLTVNRDDDLDTFYKLYLKTMRRHGSPQLPMEVFEALAARFGDDFGLHFVERNGEKVAGMMSLDTGKERNLWIAASNRSGWEDRPNDLLYAETIRNAANRGLSVVDFGRTERGSGVFRFKERFGGTERELVSFVWPSHRIGRASIAGYRRLAPLTEALSPVVTHPSIGPRLKRWMHE